MMHYEMISQYSENAPSSLHGETLSVGVRASGSLYALLKGTLTRGENSGVVVNLIM